MSQHTILDWFSQNVELAQWFVVGILAISAILIIWQIREQTKTRKGGNFIKVIEILNEDKMLQSLESVYNYSRWESKEKDDQGKPLFRGIDELKNSDTNLSEDIRGEAIRIRENYHVVGVMIKTGLINKVPFMYLQSTQVRDMWELLNENIQKMRDERKRNEDEILHWRGFEWLAKICEYWLVISFAEKSFILSFPSWFPEPGYPLFELRMYINKKFGKTKSK